MTNAQARAIVARLGGQWVGVGSPDHKLLCTAAAALGLSLQTARRVRVDLNDSSQTDLPPGAFGAGAFD